MKHVLLSLTIGLVLGGAGGWYAGHRAADKGWERRTITGVAVDCYDSNGNPVHDRFDGFAAKYGGVTTACGPGQTARVHQPERKP
jgi:hypothetical protein